MSGVKFEVEKEQGETKRGWQGANNTDFARTLPAASLDSTIKITEFLYPLECA